MWAWVLPRVRNIASTWLKQKNHANSCWHWAWPLTFKFSILAYFCHHIPAIWGKRRLLAHKQSALEEHFLKKNRQTSESVCHQHIKQPKITHWSKDEGAMMISLQLALYKWSALLIHATLMLPVKFNWRHGGIYEQHSILGRHLLTCHLIVWYSVRAGVPSGNFFLQNVSGEKSALEAISDRLG